VLRPFSTVEGTATVPNSESRKDVWNEVPLPTESRYQLRADGNREEMFRVNFVGAVVPAEMREIGALLLDIVNESADIGILALTKLEFLEPDACDYRYLCIGRNGERVHKMYKLWSRMNEIHRIRNIDGLSYDWLLRSGDDIAK
jgi:hypothetical protein